MSASRVQPEGAAMGARLDVAGSLVEEAGAGSLVEDAGAGSLVEDAGAGSLVEDAGFM